MVFSLNDLLFLTFSALGVVALSLPILMKLAPLIGMVDHPAHRKIHTKPVPYLGGVGVSLGILLSIAAWQLLFSDSHSIGHFKVWCIVLFSLAAMLLGLADDKYELRARNKLVFQIIIATLFSVFVSRFEGFTLPSVSFINLSFLSVPITVFWIVAVINAVNLIDGIDGLAGTVSACILVSIYLLARIAADSAILPVASAGFGAILGFLIYNFKPAKIYMGDAGSHGLGMLIAAALLLLGKDQTGFALPNFETPGSEPYPYQAITCTLIIAYPALEISLSVARRLMRGKSIGSADRSHIHHTLLQKNWSAPNICLAAALVQILCAGIVLSIIAQNRGLTAWLLAIAGIVLGIGLHYCGYVYIFLPSRLRDTRPHFLIANHFINMQKLKIELAESYSEIVTLINQTAVEFDIKQYSISIPLKNSTNESWTASWSRPVDAHGSFLTFLAENAVKDTDGRKDQFADLDSGVTAQWQFETHHAEHDIDMEYRILMNEFIRKALARMSTIGPGEEAGSASLNTGLTSGLLKRRAQSRLPSSPESTSR